MGQWFKFVCDDCGYEAEVSGGPDAGMLVTVRTMSCGGCKNLVDVVLSTHGYGDEDPRLQRSIGRCPKCRRKTGLEPWGKEKAPLGSFDSPVRWPEDFVGDDAPRESEVWGSCPRCGGDVRSHGVLGIWD